MARKEHIVRYTADELRALRDKGQAGSDWERAARSPVPSGEDPDDAMDWVDMDLVTTERAKLQASLEIDADVLRWFRSQGRGYQTTINAVLRKYFEQHSG